VDRARTNPPMNSPTKLDPASHAAKRDDLRLLIDSRHPILSGSHAIYVRHSDQARVVIPMHKGELKRKTLRGIIQDLKIAIEEFASLLGLT
jgi:hypothetical protein